ncbi:amidase family protein [Aquihabitans sp. McL0605]|uniref:amidase family protein n=1 Tax=Aquihabitans sp. McL0605 TaxID=3415671 RepID=UPI003CF151EB
MRSDAPGHPLDSGISGLRTAYQAGLDPVAVVDEVLARIDGCDDPAIWIDVEPADALRAAAKGLVDVPMDGRPLWGVPFAVKDNIDVAGRVTSTGLPGTDTVPDRSATVIDRLLAAGALYVGKTNLDQFATGLVGTRSPFGVPVNPLDPTLIPGGSSSGSAVAVALGHVPFALGTDTAGSGRVPAAMCGIVGLKGAPGTRPIDGIVPASPTIDCVSTFATSVADGLAVESVMASGAWPVAEGPFTVAVAGGADAVAADLAAAGMRMVDVDLAPFHEAGDLLYGGPWLADRTAALAHILDGAPNGLVDVVRTVVAGGEAYRGTEVFDAIRRLGELRDELAPWWDRTDVLVVPTVSFLPTLDEVADDPIGVNARLGRHTTFANLLGLAAIAVPAPEGPGGVTVLGPAGHAASVAAVAAILHREELTAGAEAAGGRIHLAVVGAHLRGEPLNHQLTDQGAELVAATRTSLDYRLYRLQGGPPVRPGLERVGAGGRAIEVEVWAIDAAGLGRVVAAVAPPLGIGSVELADGRWVKGFICETRGLADATDITAHGGWRAYLRSKR